MREPTKTHSTTHTWQEIELLGMHYYLAGGWRVLTPLIETHDYDFVVEKDAVFKRINVKLAGYKSPNQLAISQASGSAGKKKHHSNVDEYLVYIPNQDRFITLPGDYLQATVSKSRGIQVKYLNP